MANHFSASEICLLPSGEIGAFHVLLVDRLVLKLSTETQTTVDSVFGFHGLFLRLISLQTA